MCFWLCFQHISDENIISDFKKMLESNLSSYMFFNETSILFLILAYMGLNGLEAKEYATKILNRYIQYKLENLAVMSYPSVEYVKKVIEKADNQIDELNSKGIHTKEDIRMFFNQSS